MHPLMGPDRNDTLAAPASCDTGDITHREAEAKPNQATASWLEANLPLSLDAYEKAALERALICSWGDAAEAARMLGIGRSTFYRKAGKHGIHLGGARGDAAAQATAGPRADEPAAPGESLPRR